MRVLFLAPQPFYRLRGVCIAHRRCLEVLSDMGAEVDLLTFPFGSDVEFPLLSIHRVWRAPGVRDIPIGPSWRKLVQDAFLFLHAAWLCVRRGHEIVHASEESAFLAVLLKSVFRFKLIYDMDDVLSARLRRGGFLRAWILLRLVEALERWTLRRCDLILTNSLDTTQYAQRHAAAGSVFFYDHVPPLPAAGLTQAQRRELRRAWGLEGRRLILYAGNLEPYQGVGLLVRSMSGVLRDCPDACCLIIGGEPAQIEDLRSLAERHGVASALRWLGQRPLEETFQCMQAVDVLVSPMVEEKAVPMKLYAYLAAGVPIVATDLPNHTQLLQGGRAALVPPCPEALAAAIARVLTAAPVDMGVSAQADQWPRPDFVADARIIGEAYQRAQAGGDGLG